MLIIYKCTWNINVSAFCSNHPKSATKWKILQSILNSNRMKGVNSLNRCTTDLSHSRTLKTTRSHQSFRCFSWQNNTGLQSINQSSSKFFLLSTIALSWFSTVPKTKRKLGSNTIQRAVNFCTAKTLKMSNIRIEQSFIAKCWETTKYYMHQNIMNSIHK